MFFVLQFAMLIVQAYWVCEVTHTGWKQIPGSMCVLPDVVPISQVVSEPPHSLITLSVRSSVRFSATVISDSILIATPLMVRRTSLFFLFIWANLHQIIRGVHIRALRFRLFSIFSMSIATTLASLAHAILVMASPGVWETIFGAATQVSSPTTYFHSPFVCYSFFTGGVEAAVSVIVCSMSVIIPAVLRALGVGDPFMREDTVDPNLSTGVEIARMTSTRVELGLPGTRGTALTDSDESEGASGTVVSRRRDSIDLATKGDHKYRLTTEVVPLADECDITDSLVRARSLPVVEKDRGIDAESEEKNGKRNST